MERLTNTAWRNFDPWECCGQDNFCKRGCHEKGGCNNGCIVPKLYGRLAAYEDTGLAPEEIKDSIGWMSPVCVRCDGKTNDGIRTEKCGYPDNIAKCLEQSKHLLELAQAEQDGRLVVLPCKVGDTIWRIKCFADWPDIGKPYVEADAFLYRDIYYFGKTVFLTREEAEAALTGKGISE